MFDVKKLDKKEIGMLDKKVAEYRKKLEEQLSRAIEEREKNIKIAQQAKDLAEQLFPKAMIEIEKKALSTMAQSRRSFSFEVDDVVEDDDTGIVAMFLTHLLMDALFLSGFVCTANDYDACIDISW